MSVSKGNPFIDRYVQNTDSEISPLKPISPSKINHKINVNNINNNIVNNSPFMKKNSLIGSNNSSPTRNIKGQVSFHATNDEGKENLNRTKILDTPKIISPTRGIKTQQTSSNNEDISKYTKDELKYYEFLCRVGEIKQWIETLIQESLPSEIELACGDHLRDGVTLAKLTQRINPDLSPSIFPSGNKLQFKHTQNINQFFSLVEHVGVPDSFRFELQDLYNKKNLPQVFETLYILITIINKKWPGKTSNLSNLSGILSFNKNDLNKCKRNWPRIRDFKSLGTSLQVSQPASPVSKKKHVPEGLINDFSTFEKKSKTFLDSPQKITHNSNNIPRLHKSDDTINDENHSSSSTSINVETSNVTYKKSNILDLPVTPKKNLLNSKFDYSQSKFSIPRSPKHESLTATLETPDYDKNSNSPTRRYALSPPVSITNNNLFSAKKPNLDYSPTKTNSLSYYSPTISKYLSYETDFYMRRSQARKEDVEYYQGFNYSPSRYSPIRRQRMTEDDINAIVIDIQSFCRGANKRFEFYMQRKLLELFNNNVVKFQSLCRGHLERKHCQTELARKPKTIPNIQQLQSNIRGNTIRYRMDKTKFQLLRQEKNIVILQTFCRSIVTRKKTGENLTMLRLLKSPATKLQSLIRGQHIRNQIQNKSCHGYTIFVQSVVRGYLIRAHFNSINVSNKEVGKIVTLQSIIRSKKIRQNYYEIFTKAKKNEYISKVINARIKGQKVRAHYYDLLCNNQNGVSIVTKLQSVIKGILVRYTLDVIDDVIESNNLHFLQAHIRGALLRCKMSERNQYFIRNARSIVRVQSQIRMYLQRKAYVQLLEFPNPSLWAVKKFTHLLNDSGSIENAQDKLESLQATLDSENMKKNKLQSLIAQEMDIINTMRSYGLSDNNLKNLVDNAVDSNDCRHPTLNKLFFLLQVNPQYWKILYTHNPGFVERNIYNTFKTTNERMEDREKMYFTRLIKEFLQTYMDSIKDINQFLSGNAQFWEELLMSFLQKEYPEIFSFFIPLLQYVNNKSAEFDSDPNVIYEKLYHRAPPVNYNAISDDGVKSKFIENLRNIWHAVEMIAEVFTRKSHSVPIEVKYICTKVFGFAADKDADELNSLRCVSKVLLGSFVSEYIGNRQTYGFKDDDLVEMNNKLCVLSDALINVFELREFTGFYDPLNQYLAEIRPHIKNILYSMLIDPEYEHDGDRLIYFDMVNDAPRLELLSQKAKEVYTEFKEIVNHFSPKDVIVEVLNNKSDLGITKNGRIFLHLDASIYRFLISEDKMRKLYDQTKRALVYMSQIEEVDTNFYDLLVSAVLPEDEPNFQKFLAENRKVAEDPLINRMEPINYFTLKNATLKKVHELEVAGIISTGDKKMQNILNDIANTIKNPRYAGEYIDKELDISQKTIKALTDSNVILEQKLSEYKKQIEKAIKSLQRSRDFLPPSKSTFDNFKSVVKKVGHSDSTKLQGLIFKWNTRQLYERGVIKNIVGEKLAEQTVKVFGSSGPRFPEIMFKISTSDGSKFCIQLQDKRKGPDKRHADVMDKFTFEKLLSAQVGKKDPEWTLLNSKVTFNTSSLLRLIIDTFFR